MSNMLKEFLFRRLNYGKTCTLLTFFILSTRFLLAQWGSDVRLTANGSASETSNNNAWCVAAAPGGTVHVVWFDERDAGYDEIYYKRSTDYGTSWSADIPLTPSDLEESSYPAICVSGANVHVVWRDWRDGNAEIYYKRSTDSGASWSSDVRLTNDAYYSEYPSISVSGLNLHVVWEDSRAGGGNWEIYCKSSTDGGLSWGADTRISNALKGSWNASVSASGSNVHVAWRDDRDGPGSLDYGEIYYRRSTDNGASWGSETCLTNNLNAESWYACVSSAGSYVHVAWMDYRDGNSEIYYKRSTDGGTSWGADTRLTNDAAGSWQPSLAVSGARIHVVWEDRRDGSWKIYYNRSLDSGGSWGIDTQLTNTADDTDNPSVAVADSIVHVVWFDWRDGNKEIYYKRNPTGNIGIEERRNDGRQATDGALEIEPNPFTDFAVVSGYEKENIVVYDITGKLVRICKGDRIGKDLAPGVFFAVLQNRNIKPVRFVKAR